MNLFEVDEWMESTNFSIICEEAERGNLRSAKFINEFVFELRSLLFHLGNDSGDRKIEEQICKLELLIKKSFLLLN